MGRGRIIEIDKLKELEFWSPSSVKDAVRVRFLVPDEWNSYLRRPHIRFLGFLPL
jgi:hypothetical protein